MSEILGHGRIVVEVEENVGRELAAVESKVDKTMKKIDAKKALMTFDGNLGPFQKKVDEAESKVKHWRAEAEKAAKLGLSTKAAERHLKDWEGKLKERRVARDTVELDTSQARKQRAALQKMEADAAEASVELDHVREESFKKVEEAKTRAASEAARERVQVARDEQKASEDNLKRLREAEKKAENERLAARKKTARQKKDGEEDYLADLVDALGGSTDAWEEDAEALARHGKAQKEAQKAQDDYNESRRRLNKTEEETNLILGQRSQLTDKTEMVSTKSLGKFREFNRADFDGPDAGRDRDEYARLKADIERNGIKSPIKLYVDKLGNAKIGEGNHRLAIAKELGIQEVPVLVIPSTDATGGGKGLKLPQQREENYRPSDVGLKARKAQADELADHQVSTAAFVAAREREIALSQARAERAIHEETLATKAKATKAEADARATRDRKQQENEAKNGKKYIDLLSGYLKAADKQRLADDKRVADSIIAQAKATSAASIKAVDNLRKEREKAAKDLALWQGKAMDKDKVWEATQARLAVAKAKQAKADQRQAANEAAASLRAIGDLERLQLAYLAAGREKARLEKTTKFAAAPKQELEIKTAAARGEVAKLAAQIRALGSDPVTIKVDSTGEKTIRRVFDAISSLGGASVRIGPLTASLASLGKAMIILGPIITSLVGSMSALIGVTGAGLLGALTIAGGAAAAFGVAMIGIVGVMKPAIGEMKDALTASKAYDKAVTEHGKNSDQAAKKLKIYNNVMKAQSKEARESFLAAGGMSDAWKKITAPGREKFFNIVGNGIDFANKNMQWFGEKTNGTFKRLEVGTKSWLDRLDSAGGRDVTQGLFDSFNRALPSLMRSIGNLGAYFGKVFGQGAKEGEKLTGTFEAWTDRLNKGFDASKITRLVDDAKSLGRFLLSAGRAMKAFFGGGRQAGAGFLDDMAQGMDRWTKKMNGEGAKGLKQFFKNSVANTKALFNALGPILGQFLAWSAALAPVVTGMLFLAGVATKVVAAILRGVEAIGNFIPGVSLLSEKLTGTKNTAAMLGATIALLWGVGKAAAFFTMLTRGVAIMRSLRVATMGVAAAQALMNGSGAMAGIKAALAARTAANVAAKAAVSGAAASTVATGAGAAVGGGAAAGAAKTVGKMALLRGAIMGVGSAFGATSLAGSALATGGLSLVAAGAIYGGYKLLTMKSSAEKLKDSLKGVAENTKNYSATSKSLMGVLTAAGGATRNYRQSVKDVSTAQARFDKLTASGKKGTVEYQMALDELNAALNNRATADAQVNQTSVDRSKLNFQMYAQTLKMKDAEKILTREKGQAAKMEREINEARKAGVPEDMLAGDKRELAKAQREVADAQAAVNRNTAAAAKAEREAAVGMLNYKRAVQGFIPLAGRAATALANLSKKNPNVAARVSVKYADPKDAAGVAKRAQAALGSGVTVKSIMKIIGDSSNADQAIARLRAITLKTKVQKIIENGGPKVMGQLQKILGTKLSNKEFAAKLRDLASGKIKTIDGMKISSKDFAAILRDLASGRISGIKGLLDALRDKTVTLKTTVLTNYVTNGRKTDNSGRSNPAQRASGRKNIGREVALIGEGRADEHVVNPEKGYSYKTDGPRFTRLDKGDFVIPTEPAFRSRGRDFLTQAVNSGGQIPGLEDIAKDLGMPAFKKGKGVKRLPKPKKLSKTKRHQKNGKSGDDKEADKLPITDQYLKGGIEMNDVNSDANEAQSNLDSRQGAINSANRSKGSYQNQYNDARKDYSKAKSTKERNKAANRATGLLRSIEKTNDKLDLLRYGQKGASGPAAESKADLVKIRDRTKARVDALDAANANMEKQQADVNKLATQMNTQSTIFNASKDPKVKSAAEAEYNRLRGLRQGILGTLAKLYTDAAGSVKPKKGNKLSPEERSFKAGLEANAATISDDWMTQATADPITGPASGGEPDVSLANYIKGYSMDGELGNLQLARSTAKLDNVENDAKTLKNDADTQADIAGFYERLLGRLNAENAPVETKIEATEALASAREEAKSLAGGGASAGTESQSLARDTARYDVMRTYGSNSFSGEALASAGTSSVVNGMMSGGRVGPALSGSSSGGAGMMDSSGNNTAAANRSTTITNNFAAPPPDPHTWSQGVAFEVGGGL